MLLAGGRSPVADNDGLAANNKLEDIPVNIKIFEFILLSEIVSLTTALEADLLLPLANYDTAYHVCVLLFQITR